MLTIPVYNSAMYIVLYRNSKNTELIRGGIVNAKMVNRTYDVMKQTNIHATAHIEVLQV